MAFPAHRQLGDTTWIDDGKVNGSRDDVGNALL